MPESERSSGAHVIGASALGTLFEWYDFFLYGALASSFASHFFSAVDERTAFIFALATFAVGFIVRPLGALVFGRIGDLVGRKVTFLATLAVMGLATFLVGVLPDYASIGIAAPLLLVALRILQGLAIGGEFGGAIVYVAEHAPPGRRGLHTSFIPAMALGGLLLSLAVIAATRAAMTPAEFSAWGWRVPFLLSVILLGVSLWIRLRLQESPVFRRMQAERSLSRAPVAETFLQGRNLRLVLAALFGCVIGQAVLFYMSTFYAYYFLERVARVDGFTVAVLTAISLAIAAPLFIASGWLSDRIGRKPILLGAVALAALLYFPLFASLLEAANPELARARETSPVVVAADPRDCSLLFDPLGRASNDRRSCDVVTSYLARAGISHEMRTLPSGEPALLEIGGLVLVAPQPGALEGTGSRAGDCGFPARGKVGACRRRLPERSRSGPHRQATGRCVARRAPRIRSRSLGRVRCLARRDVPGANPLHGAFISSELRQWMVRRVIAGDHVHDRGRDRRCLCRSLVPGERRCALPRRRLARRSRNPRPPDLVKHWRPCRAQASRRVGTRASECPIF